MHPPYRQSVARISEELGIHVMTLYKWRKAWRLQVEVVPSSEREPEGWSAAGKFTVVLESAGLNATELSSRVLKQGLTLPQRRSTRSTRCFRQPEVVWMNPLSHVQDTETATLAVAA
jgi:transposase-like protein